MPILTNIIAGKRNRFQCTRSVQRCWWHRCKAIPCDIQFLYVVSFGKGKVCEANGNCFCKIPRIIGIVVIVLCKCMITVNRTIVGSLKKIIEIWANGVGKRKSVRARETSVAFGIVSVRTGFQIEYFTFRELFELERGKNKVKNNEAN